MIASAKKATLKWTIAALALTLVVGCSSVNNPIPPAGNGQGQTGTATQKNSGASSTPTPVTVSPGTGSNSGNPTSATTQPENSSRSLLLEMVRLAQQGKIINCNFPAKTSRIDDIEKLWGRPDQTDIVHAAKGTYITYLNHHVVFGFNKAGQVFEVRSYDRRLRSLSLSKVKEVLGTPAYDTKFNGQEIIGYKEGQDFKLEMVFSQPTGNNPNPAMDHYNVLYPQGTTDMMGAERKW